LHQLKVIRGMPGSKFEGLGNDPASPPLPPQPGL